VTLTADLEGYAPDQPGWVFVLVPWDNMPKGVDCGPLDLVLATSASQQWRADPTAMALLPANADFLASRSRNKAGVVIVYQAPYDSLADTFLGGRHWGVETNRPEYQVDPGLTPTPPMPTPAGAAPIPKNPAGQTVELGDCAVRIDKVVYTDRVGGYREHRVSDDWRFLAVTSTVTPLSDGARCMSPFNVGLALDHRTFHGTHPLTWSDRLATALAQPNQGGISTDGSVSATVVFHVNIADQHYLIFTDSTAGQIKFELGLDDAESVADIAPEQPLIPRGQTASLGGYMATVRGVTLEGEHVTVQLDLTNSSHSEWTLDNFDFMDGNGRCVGLDIYDSDSLYGKVLGKGESITGWLTVHTTAPLGARLLLWSGLDYEAPVQLSLWA